MRTIMTMKAFCLSTSGFCLPPRTSWGDLAVRVSGFPPRSPLGHPPRCSGCKIPCTSTKCFHCHIEFCYSLAAVPKGGQLEHEGLIHIRAHFSMMKYEGNFLLWNSLRISPFQILPTISSQPLGAADKRITTTPSSSVLHTSSKDIPIAGVVASTSALSIPRTQAAATVATAASSSSSSSSQPRTSAFSLRETPSLYRGSAASSVSASAGSPSRSSPPLTSTLPSAAAAVSSFSSPAVTPSPPSSRGPSRPLSTISLASSSRPGSLYAGKSIPKYVDFGKCQLGPSGFWIIPAGSYGGHRAGFYPLLTGFAGFVPSWRAASFPG